MTHPLTNWPGLLLREESPPDLETHTRISAVFRVEGRLVIKSDPKCEFVRIEREVSIAPYTKDYDQLPNNRPVDWAAQFDVSTWMQVLAWSDKRPVGGAIVALNAPELSAPEDAVLWDLRVAPSARGRGLGSTLVEKGMSLAREAGCGSLVIETQNNNVAACRLYEKMGCTLFEARERAYPHLPDETLLMWKRRLT